MQGCARTRDRGGILRRVHRREFLSKPHNLRPQPFAGEDALRGLGLPRPVVQHGQQNAPVTQGAYSPCTLSSGYPGIALPESGHHAGAGSMGCNLSNYRCIIPCEQCRNARRRCLLLRRRAIRDWYATGLRASCLRANNWQVRAECQADRQSNYRLPAPPPRWPCRSAPLGAMACARKHRMGASVPA